MESELKSMDVSDTSPDIYYDQTIYLLVRSVWLSNTTSPNHTKCRGGVNSDCSFGLFFSLLSLLETEMKQELESRLPPVVE